MSLEMVYETIKQEFAIFMGKLKLLLDDVSASIELIGIEGYYYQSGNEGWKMVFVAVILCCCLRIIQLKGMYRKLTSSFPLNNISDGPYERKTDEGDDEGLIRYSRQSVENDTECILNAKGMTENDLRRLINEGRVGLSATGKFVRSSLKQLCEVINEKDGNQREVDKREDEWAYCPPGQEYSWHRFERERAENSIRAQNGFCYLVTLVCVIVGVALCITTTPPQ